MREGKKTHAALEREVQMLQHIDHGEAWGMYFVSLTYDADDVLRREEREQLSEAVRINRWKRCESLTVVPHTGVLEVEQQAGT